MLPRPHPLRLVRGLRFRLAVSYVVFFTLVLGTLGVVFRATLSGIQEKQVENVLDEEWGAVKGYLRFDFGPYWFYDKTDPEENLIVERIRSVSLLTDSAGHPLQWNGYDSLGFDSPERIRATLKMGPRGRAVREQRDSRGRLYVIRSGTIVDQRGNFYYFAIGRNVEDNVKLRQEFTFQYAMISLGALLVSGSFGWFLARRALAPVNSVAEAAQHITHSNLRIQIPTRGAGDELDRLVEAFNRMIERLGLSFAQIQQFSADVSHELRTPLTIIRGQLEVALITAKTSEQYRDAMVNALEDVERLSNIVRALLMLSQAESGQLVLKKAELDLSQAVRDLVEEFQIPAEAEGVELTADVPQHCRVFADRVQIERLITNLVSNAIKYTPRDGKVRVELTGDAERVRLVVADTGVGIAADHLPHIFDRFYRVPSADPEKGLGLGLSFVAWIVKAQGGTISVESEVNTGSRFTVILPSGKAEIPNLPAASDAAENITNIHA